MLEITVDSIFSQWFFVLFFNYYYYYYYYMFWSGSDNICFAVATWCGSRLWESHQTIVRARPVRPHSRKNRNPLSLLNFHYVKLIFNGCYEGFAPPFILLALPVLPHCRIQIRRGHKRPLWMNRCSTSPCPLSIGRSLLARNKHIRYVCCIGALGRWAPLFFFIYGFLSIYITIF
jgi:hypothetical protein